MTDRVTHVVLVGTKPDIIKQAPIYSALRRRGHRVLLCHTGQHFDYALSGAMLSEFGIDVDHSLEAAAASENIVSAINSRLSAYLESLASSGEKAILYAHGDTTTAMAGALAAFRTNAGLVHVEAGLRTLSPTKAFFTSLVEQIGHGSLDWNWFSRTSRDELSYERGSLEPLPEQFNTRVVDAAAHLHCAPVELNREFLISEGYAPRTTEVVGNSVVDALEPVDLDAVGEVLRTYPQLMTGEFIRFCVHRKENTGDRNRFCALLDAMAILLEKGLSILFIRLPGTEFAIDRFDRRDWLNDLMKRHPTRFLSTGVWPSYADVLRAMRRCAVVATDSGSIQEEVNVLGTPCVTLRFGTDRAESVLAGGNFLAPPVNQIAVSTVVEEVFRNRSQIDSVRVYPPAASETLVDAVERRLALGEGFTHAEEERYGISGYPKSLSE